METPCAVSLIVVGSFTLFTVGCGCIVNWVLCLRCGWIFNSAVYGTARHLLYCWLEFYYVGFLHYRRRTVLLCPMYVAACSISVVVYSVLLYVATACLLRPCWERLLVVLSWGESLSFSRLGGVLVGAG